MVLGAKDRFGFRIARASTAVAAATALLGGAAWAADGDAAPEPSVALYGILDAGVRHVDQVSAAGGLTSFQSGLNTSRVGLRGDEPFTAPWGGGRWDAGLRLEAGFNPGTGAQSNTALIDRTAAASLGTKDLRGVFGRQEGFGYESAASGVTDPLAMALNLPDYASPAASNGKAPVLGANPLQGIYSYTYGQLRFDNALRLTTEQPNWSGGVLYAFGGVAGSTSDDSVRAAQLRAFAGPWLANALVQQSLDATGRRSTLASYAAVWHPEGWKIQAGLHSLRVDAGFNSSGLGNGASSTGILSNSTTVATTLASAKEDLHINVGDLGVTWNATRTVPLTAAVYKTRSDGAGDGSSLAWVVLAKWYLAPSTALYAEYDRAHQNGTLALHTVDGDPISIGYMVGINYRF